MHQNTHMDYFYKIIQMHLKKKGIMQLKDFSRGKPINEKKISPKENIK